MPELKKTFLSTIKILFFLCIGVLCIWLFIKDLTTSEKNEIIESFRDANYFWVILALFIGLISHIIRTLRWQMLLSPMGYKSGFTNTFLALMIGYFANLAVPRLGEVSRCGFLARYEKIPFQKSFGTVVAERAFDLITFIVLFFINLLVQYNRLKDYLYETIFSSISDKFSSGAVSYFLYAFLGVITLLIILYFIFRQHLAKYKFFQKIIKVLREFIEGLKSLTKVKSIPLFLLYTVLIWIMYFLMTYLCFFSIDGVSGLGPMAGFSVLVLGTIGIIVVQGGIGVFPLIVSGTLSSYGISETIAYATGWIIWTSQTVIIIIAGIISLILLPIINKNKNGHSTIDKQ